MSKKQGLKKQRNRMLIERVRQLPTKVARLLSPKLPPRLGPTPQKTPIEIACYLLALSMASERVRSVYIARWLTIGGVALRAGED